MSSGLWQSTTSLQILQTRASLIDLFHAFFNKRGVLLVDTPAISQYGNTDPGIESFLVKQSSETNQYFYLYSSPEFAMKRLLANGMGSIYQICKVFRASEQGRFHNPEFTLVEWYRIDFDHFDLMIEMQALFSIINQRFPFYDSVEKISYQQLFLDYTKLDPLLSTITELREYIKNNITGSLQNMNDLSFNELCDYLMSHVIQQRMPKKCLMFVYDYPASQASLAQLNTDKLTARRFEVFVSGIELANGFHELRDAEEQRRRFTEEQQQRAKALQQAYPLDENLIDALQSGLPNCAGVALGLERLLMLLVNAKHINEVLTFPFDRA